MEIELDDFSILNQETVDIYIGPKRKLLKLRQLYISEYYGEFIPRILVLIEYANKTLDGIKLPEGNDWENKDKMAYIQQKYTRRMFSYKIARRMFAILLKKSGLLKMRLSYFLKYVKVGQLYKIFFHVWKFNVDGVKKNLQEMYKEILGAKSDLHSQILSGSSARGGLKKTLPARFQKFPN